MAKRKNPMAVALGKRSGKARMKKLTPEKRSEVARLGAAKRWEGHKAARPASARKKPSR